MHEWLNISLAKYILMTKVHRNRSKMVKITTDLLNTFKTSNGQSIYKLNCIVKSRWFFGFLKEVYKFKILIKNCHLRGVEVNRGHKILAKIWRKHTVFYDKMQCYWHE